MGLPVFAIPIPPLKHNGYFCDWQTLRWGAGAVDPKRGDISSSRRSATTDTALPKENRSPASTAAKNI
jgi:hypothetical protein